MNWTRAPGGRLAAFLALVMQLAVAAALPFVHARVEAAEFAHEVHIGAEGKGVCLPHNDSYCQICRHQHAADIRSGSGQIVALPPIHSHRPACTTTDTGPDSPYHQRPFGPRAPPLV